MMAPDGRACASLLLEAAKAFAVGHLEHCAQAAAKCAAAAWHLLQAQATEAVLHAHALAHAMLAVTETDAQKAMLHADLSLSLCPDLPIAAVHSVMKSCNERCQSVAPSLEDGLAWEIPSDLPATAKRPVVQKPIHRCSNLSLVEFRDTFLKLQQPGVIEGHLTAAGWSTERWRDLRFWAGHGHRTVPIEMGFSENDAQSVALQHSDAEGSMRLREFVMRFLLPSNTVLKKGFQRSDGAIDEWFASEVAYMAQHQLLLQIPELRNDILVPHYCALGELQTVNVWIGTAGTVTALHYDLDDNFLVQVAGYKYLGSSFVPIALSSASRDARHPRYLRLYSPDEGDHLYAKDAPRDRQKKHGASYSPVRVERPDLQVHPDFEKANFVETILGPGEMLFIPKRWWHYVRSLTTSVSVNFWFWLGTIFSVSRAPNTCAATTLSHSANGQQKRAQHGSAWLNMADTLELAATLPCEGLKTKAGIVPPAMCFSSGQHDAQKLFDGNSWVVVDFSWSIGLASGLLQGQPWNRSPRCYQLWDVKVNGTLVLLRLGVLPQGCHC